jgi:hypothetical protein
MNTRVSSGKSATPPATHEHVYMAAPDHMERDLLHMYVLYRDYTSGAVVLITCLRYGTLMTSHGSYYGRLL